MSPDVGRYHPDPAIGVGLFLNHRGELLTVGTIESSVVIAEEAVRRRRQLLGVVVPIEVSTVATSVQ